MRVRRRSRVIIFLSTGRPVKFDMPSFSSYAIADGIYNLLLPDKTALRGLSSTDPEDFQLLFEFG
jgi:hypothetical protein